MKSISLILIFIVALAGACSSPAGALRAKQKTQPSVTKAKQVHARHTHDRLTGSFLKQDVRRSGFVTDSANQVVVIDQAAIERSGASDVRQLLVRYGLRR